MARKNRDFPEDGEEVATPTLICWLCTRALGDVVEWHHPIPKSRGGKLKEPIHPICHQTIHVNFSNSDLEKRYSTAEAMLTHEAIKRFVDWIANKPPDFDAPTKKR